MWPLSEPAGAEAATSGHLCEEDDGSMAYSVAWQWRLDRHVWQDYRDDVAAIIENTFKSGKNKLDLSAYFPDFPYKISFSTMVQKNKRTKYHRAIRRVTIALPHLPSNLENGSEKDTDGATENLSSYDHDNTLITTGACGSNPTGKKHFIKHVSAFWNKLKKSVDSESSHSSDAEESFTNKKQCTVENAPTGSRSSSNLLNRNGTFTFDYENTVMNLPNFRPDDTLSASMQFATVNGNVWKQSWPPNTHHSLLKPVPGIPPLPCEDEKPTKKGRRKMVATAIPVEIDVVVQFTEECSISPQENGEEQICIICYESLHEGSPYDDDTTVIRLQLCSHVFHRSCVKAMCESGAKDHLQCPTCKTIHGVKYGNQPPGKMVFHVLPYSLPGYPECDTIRIIYNIHPGIQGPEHPNPGRPYHAYGFPRHCYLPDNEIGRKVLRLLVKAWERRLIFTIGTSATTGATNTVTWNEIHHKTEFGCNRRGHGFPDLNYFENVISELAAHGITESKYSWTPV